MFESIAADGFKPLEETETPTGSLPEEKTQPKDKETVSEDDKDTSKPEDKGAVVDKDKDVPFHEHSRFKELVKEKNTYKKDLEKTTESISELTKRLSGIEQSLNKAAEPDMETFDDINSYVRDLPAKLKAEIRQELEEEQKRKKSESAQIQKVIDEQLSSLKESGKEYNEEELIKFAVEYGLNDLVKAHSLLEITKQKTDEAKKKGEELGKRKKDSNIHHTKTFEPGVSIFDRTQSLDSIIEQAQNNLTK